MLGLFETFCSSFYGSCWIVPFFVCVRACLFVKDIRYFHTFVKREMWIQSQFTIGIKWQCLGCLKHFALDSKAFHTSPCLFWKWKRRGFYLFLCTHNIRRWFIIRTNCVVTKASFHGFFCDMWHYVVEKFVYFCWTKALPRDSYTSFLAMIVRWVYSRCEGDYSLLKSWEDSCFVNFHIRESLRSFR